MRKIITILAIFTLLGIGILRYSKTKEKKADKKIEVKKIEHKAVVEKKTIFIPYWVDMSQKLNIDKYDRIIYFGDKNIDKFVGATHGSPAEKYMTVVMTNSDENLKILDDKSSWEKIATQSVETAKKYGFDGIVLDLEMGILPVNAEIEKKINEFIIVFKSTCFVPYKFAVLLYGDTFYRHRPYDVKTISENVDEIMVMAYDFHKSYGEPGPNFGFEDNDYSFKQMTDDFLKYVPAEKLTVIFGMYGYDWMVDERKRPIRPGVALTLNEIRKQFLNNCQWKDCLIRRDDLSKETEIDYVKSEIRDNFAVMDYHIIWFEDEQSVKVKSDYLKSKGVGSVGYWAYDYF